MSEKEDKISSWPPEEEEISTWPPEEEKISTWPPEDEKISTWPTEDDKISSWPPEEEEISTWPPEEEKISTWPPEEEKISTWPPEEEKISTWPPEDEKISTWPPEEEKISTWPPEEEKISTCPEKEKFLQEDAISLPEMTPLTKLPLNTFQDARTALAVWYRRNSKRNELVLPEGLGAASRINYLATSQQGKHFLKQQISASLLWMLSSLLFSNLLSEENLNCDNYHYYYTLASYHDLCQDKTKAFEYVRKSLMLMEFNEDLLESSDIKEYLELIKNLNEDERNCIWLFCKLKLQFKIKESATAKHKSSSKLKVDRCNHKDLSVEQFKVSYCGAQRPVVITNLESVIAGPEWTIKHIRKVCGSKQVSLKSARENSTEWAGLESNHATSTVDQYLDTLPGDQYLFDWSLPLNAPELAAQFNLPEYFEDNILLKTNPGAMYRDSWPSLFIGAAGTGSGLHVDAFHSHFYMYLISGKKRWTFYPAESLPLLKPVYWDSLDPSFTKDLDTTNINSFTVDLCAGEVLFVPAGSPHTVINLEDSIAVSGTIIILYKI